MLNLKLVRDEDAESPRDFDNLGIMVCFHNRHNLGDEHDLKTDDFANWDAIWAYLEAEEGARFVVPVYLMDHSGLALDTKPFGCSWDSGQVGFIYTTSEKMKEIGVTSGRVKAMLRSEVEVYGMYVEGDCWGYVIEDDDDVEGEQVDSCWGFYGEKDAKESGEEALAALKAAAEAEAEREPGTYRIVVCLDVEARSMAEAYRRVYRRMKKVDCDNFEWESSDEWYDPEANALEPGDVQEIRMKVFAEENGSG